MWKFLVKNQSIEILEREVLADHQIQYVQFKFTFDGDWKKFHKVVQFNQCDEVYYSVLGFDGTTCYLPAELHVGAVKMSVFGYDAESETTVRATTVPVTLNIRPSGFEGDDDTPIPPTPDLYTQLIKKIEDTAKGDPGKSAYEIAVGEGYTGTEEEWLKSLHGADGKDGKDGITPDLSEYPKTSEVTTIIQQEIAPISEESHTHDNKEILDAVTAPYTAEEQSKLARITPDSYATTERLNEQILLVREAIAPLEHASHTHKNKAALDNLTAEDVAAVQGLPEFQKTTTDGIQTLSEAVDTVAADTHQHSNKTVLDSIAAIDKRLDENSTNPVANYVLALAIDVLNVAKHTHGNAGTLEKITEEMLSNMQDYGPFEDWVREQIHTLFESVNNFSNTAHSHENKSILDEITADFLTLLQNLQQFEDSTNYQIQTVKESVDPVVSQAHWHHNLTILNGITQAKITEWDSVSTLKTQVNGLSTELTVWKNKCSSNSDRIYAAEATIDNNTLELSDIQKTLEAMQAQIDSIKGGGYVTVFQYGQDAMSVYAPEIGLILNGGYHLMTEFCELYPNFCTADNNHALSYNQTDFGWDAQVLTVSTKELSLSESSEIIFSYQSGGAEDGSVYLVAKPERIDVPVTIYVKDKIESGQAVSLNFKWLYADNYVSTLTECEGVSSGTYYLAWVGRSNNTHPLIRSIKILGG